MDRRGFNRSHKKIIKVSSEYSDCSKYVESRTDEYGFDYNLMHKNGTPYDDHNFDINGINAETNLPVDRHHFNRDLEYCIQNENGEWISTKKRVNDRGFDIDGNYYPILPNGSRAKYHSGRLRDIEGYNIDGLDKHRFNREHLYVNQDGTTSITNPHGFGYDGYIYEYDETTKQYIKTDRIYDDEGYDINELNEHKFDRMHLYMHQKRENPYGFHYNYKYNGVSLYDPRGFNFYGINRFTNKIYDEHFFDRDGYFYEKSPESGEYVKTDRKIDDEHFDQEGFYWQYNEKKQQFEKTTYKTNPMGIDRNGESHPKEIRDQEYLKQLQEKQRRLREEKAKKKQEEDAKRRQANLQKKVDRERQDAEEAKLKAEFQSKFDEKGICKTTNLPYDEFFFRADGIHAVKKTFQDVRGFNCIGQCLQNNNLPYDRNGFKQDGTHYITGERYYEGYNAYGVDENGKTREGKIDPRIVTAQRYIDAIFNSDSPESRQKFVSRYAATNKKTESQALQELRTIIYSAGEMYPPFKKQVQNLSIEVQRKLEEKQNELFEYIVMGNNTQKSSSNISQEIARLQEKIKAISIDGGER